MPRRALAPPLPDPDIAALAAVLADASRVAMLDVLLDGDAHPIGALARHAGISAATASSHLGRLLDANLVAVERAGREHRVRLAGPDAAELLERLAAMARPAAVWTDAARSRAGRLRFARTCYDHLAGVLGVLVTQALVDRGWLVATDGGFTAEPALADWIASHGHAVAEGSRPLLRTCLDWSERLPHVAGRLGAAIAGVFVAERWVARIRDGRALRLTMRGRAALAGELDLVLPSG